MKDVKKLPTNQLEKYSTVFMQLGLVLSLFIAFISLEYETEEKKLVHVVLDPEAVYTYTPNSIPIIYIKEPIKKKTIDPIQSQTTNLTEIKKVDNDVQKVIEAVVTPQKDIPKPLNINTLKVVKEEDDIDLNDEPKFFNSLEEAPIYRGCEGLSKEENRKCFEKKIRKFVQRNFRADLAQDLGLRAGKHRISTEFIIDKNGNITNVRINAPHKSLTKETNRIVNKIPKFTPGKQNGKEVKVRYTLPIVFRVD